MNDFRLTTPVAFIIFNRPETTARVFAEIRKARPTKLFVICDGPRKNRPDDVEKVAATREIIRKIDWECELITKFSDKNLGCKIGPADGISWVFEQVEEAIILEDDCMPDQSFFQFCQEMLNRYSHDQRISMISGDNFQFGFRRNTDSYYFSKYCLTWGWATWRDRWINSYDVTLAKWPRIRNEGWLPDMLGSVQDAKYWHDIFERVHSQKLDTAWDYQWFFANLLEGRMSITPSVNLISNTGTGMDATHTKNESSILNVRRTPIIFPLIHPLGVFKNNKADKITDKVFFRLVLSVRFGNRVLRIREKLVSLFGLR